MTLPQRCSKLVLAALLCCSAASQALEFRSVAETGTVFFSQPSSTSAKLFLASKAYPVEVVLQNQDWVRVRNAIGQMAWVPTAKLSSKRYVLVLSEHATIRRTADDAAAVLATAEQNLVLALIETPSSGWAHVRIDDKTSGYIRLSDIWGI